jgi:hypothetical protein
MMDGPHGSPRAYSIAKDTLPQKPECYKKERNKFEAMK